MLDRRGIHLIDSQPSNPTAFHNQKTHKDIIIAYSAAVGVYVVILILLLVAQIGFPPWPFMLDLVRVIYIIALPIWVLFSPLYWFYYKFGEIALLLGEGIATAALLYLFAWLLHSWHIPRMRLSPGIRSMALFAFGLWVFAVLAIEIIRFYIFIPVPIDELFYSSSQQ